MINYFVIENMHELKLFNKIYPNLENVIYILLSPNFLSFDKDLFKGRKYYFFDEKITFEQSKTLAKSINYYLWDWFCDENGKDISNLDGCSIGSALVGSIDILLNTQFRYELGLKNILKKDSKLYYFSNCEQVFKMIIPKICNKLNIENVEVKTNTKKKILHYGRMKINVSDPIGRYRYLNSIFKRNLFKDYILNLFLNKFVDTDNKKILYVQSGKLENFFYDLKKNTNFKNKHILYRSPQSLLDVLFNKRKNNHFYYFSPSYKVNHNEVKTVISNLKKNIFHRFKNYEFQISLDIMDNLIFPYFKDIFSFYKDTKKKLNSMRPDLVILSADDHEYHVIIAQAAKKLNIRTAEIPHGMYNGGYKNLKVGKFKVFDLFFCFGDAGKKILCDFGVPKKRIRVTSFPYFEKFLPIKKIKKNKSYTQCLILAPDYVNISPSEKIKDYIFYYKKIIDLLNKKNIVLKGIKFRHEHSVNLHKKVLEGKLNSINFFSGYKDLPELLNDVDIVIGPVSTALIETNLLGIDYYPYESQRFHHSTPFFYKKMYDILNVSYNINMLEKNIITKKAFKQGFSVKDLIYLQSLRSKADLYNHFIKTIYSVI